MVNTGQKKLMPVKHQLMLIKHMWIFFEGRSSFHVQTFALKIPQYFCLPKEKPLGCYFQVWSPYYQAAQCNQKKWEEVSACASIPMCYVMNTSNHVQRNFLRFMVGTWFMFIAITWLNVSEPEHWLTWSGRSGVKLPF